ncbi:MAG: M14 family zinc carboxypeptidase [Vicinamibacterales bacterium]
MPNRLPLLSAALTLAGVSLLAQSSLPTPESALGFRAGADFRLANYEESIAYFRKLDAASDRLTLIEIGRTTLGRPWQVALISSPANLSSVEKYRDIAVRLASPEGLTDEQARTLAREGKAIVHIDGGLHASEVAGAQHTIELAYDLVSGAADRKIAAILDNVILMLWPSINPDGQTIVADWYRSNVGTPYEVAPQPELYQRYIGHDNNRDAYMLNMIESREIGRTWRHWEPQIIYVHHQSSPFPTRIWLPPFAEPIATQVPPIMSRTVNMIGMAIARGLEERGQVGATHMGTGFDAWYPGYIDYLPMLQNISAFWTETALYRYATPHLYTIADYPRDMRDLRPQTLYPSPWRGGWWRLRDAVDYMITASMSVLDYAAKYREELLYNRYQAGRDQIRKYEREPPFAYFVPRQQRDPVAAVELLRRLAFNGIRVHQLSSAAVHEGVTYPAGTWVIAMNQPFGELVRQVLDVQVYPDLREFPEGPPEQPYDAAGWTLPLQMDVRVVEARAPLTSEFRGAMQPLGAAKPTSTNGNGPRITADQRQPRINADLQEDAAPFDSVPGPGFDTHPVAAAIVPAAGDIAGAGPAVALDPAQNNAFRAVNAAWKGGASVRVDGGRPGAGGRYVISGAGPAAIEGWVRDLALKAERTAVSGVELRKPRLALYQPWTASMDAGWTEWLLEQYRFDFVNVRNADIQAGALRERFDVLILADDRPASIVDGFAPGSVPPRYEGGIGARGVRALDEFVRDGGTLVCLNRSSEFAIERLQLPVKNVTAGLKRQEFFASGSILQVTTDPAHPVMKGMRQQAAVFFDGSPAFQPQDGFRGDVLARYEPKGSPLLSGYLLGERFLQGHAAALDVRHGDGHVILIGFRPQWRGQPFGTFRVLFNAVLFHGAPAAGAKGTPGFWGPPAAKE